MAAARVLNSPVREQHWFLGAVLLVLASALVAALVPSGQPSTQLIGSAFDPSTSAVALRARTQKAVDEIAQVTPGKRDQQKRVAAGSTLYIPMFPPLCWQALLVLPLGTALCACAATPRPLRLRAANAPRAPPAGSF
jgi:hypothetical protein